MTLPEVGVSAADETPPGESGLGASVERGAVWSGLNTLALRLSNILITAVVIRLVSPKEFGVFAVALTIHGVVGSLAELGAASALTRHTTDPAEAAPVVRTIALASSSLVAIAMVWSAPWLANELGSPSSASAIRVMSIAVVLTGVFAVPGALLARNFRQDRIFAATAISFVPANALLILLAAIGDGALAFAWSRVLGQLVMGVCMHRYAGDRVRFAVDLRRAGGLLAFGLPLAAANLVNVALLNVDNAIVGRVRGPAQLGVYVLAFNVANWSRSLLAAMVNGVAMPAFSRAASDPQRLRAAVLRGTRAVALLSWPIGALTVANAAPLVETLYGRTWLEAAPVLAVLALYGVVFVHALVFANVIVGTGHTKALLWLQLLWIAALVPCLVWGLRVGGLVGVGWAHVGVLCLVVFPAYLYGVRRITGVRAGSLLRAVAPAVLSAAVAASVSLVSVVVPWSIVRLLVGTALGSAVYVGLMGPSLRAEAGSAFAALGRRRLLSWVNPTLDAIERWHEGTGLITRRLGAKAPTPIRRAARRAMGSRPGRPPTVALVGMDVPIIGVRVASEDAHTAQDRSGPTPAPDNPLTKPSVTRTGQDRPARRVEHNGAEHKAAEHDGSVTRCAVVTGSLDVGGMDAVADFLARGLPSRSILVEVWVVADVGDEDKAMGRFAKALQLDGHSVVACTPDTVERLIARFRPDVVSLHGGADWVVQAFADASVPVVETLHGMHDLFEAEPEAVQLRASRVHTVVAVSDLVREQFLRLCPTRDVARVITVPNGVRSRRLDTSARATARTALGLRDEYLFVSLARHCLQKNTYALVEAFGDVARSRPDVHLVVAGHPEDPAYTAQVLGLVQRLPARDRIHVRDHAVDPAGLLAAADGFVLDSYFEGWSLASMEALTAGLPCVLADVGGAREQLAAGDCGTLVDNPLGDPLRVDWATMATSRFRRQDNRDQLVAAMTALADDRGKWSDARSQLALAAERRFDPELCLARHGEVLRHAAGSRAGSRSDAAVSRTEGRATSVSTTR